MQFMIRGHLVYDAKQKNLGKSRRVGGVMMPDVDSFYGAPRIYTEEYQCWLKSTSSCLVLVDRAQRWFCQLCTILLLPLLASWTDWVVRPMYLVIGFEISKYWIFFAWDKLQPGYFCTCEALLHLHVHCHLDFFLCAPFAKCRSNVWEFVLVLMVRNSSIYSLGELKRAVCGLETSEKP